MNKECSCYFTIIPRKNKQTNSQTKNLTNKQTKNHSNEREKEKEKVPIQRVLIWWRTRRRPCPWPQRLRRLQRVLRPAARSAQRRACSASWAHRTLPGNWNVITIIMLLWVENMVIHEKKEKKKKKKRERSTCWRLEKLMRGSAVKPSVDFIRFAMNETEAKKRLFLDDLNFWIIFFELFIETVFFCSFFFSPSFFRHPFIMGCGSSIIDGI